MTTVDKIKVLNARLNILKSRTKDNVAIQRKLERTIERLSRI